MNAGKTLAVIGTMTLLAFASACDNSAARSGEKQNVASLFFGGGAKEVTVPAGSVLTVQLEQTLSSATLQPGDGFTASVVEPLTVEGHVVADRGARVAGKVVEAVPTVGGQARLHLRFSSLELASGDQVALDASIQRRAKRLVLPAGTTLALRLEAPLTLPPGA